MKQELLSLVCKHKHMLKNGAPPDKFGVQYRLLHTSTLNNPIEFYMLSLSGSWN